MPIVRSQPGEVARFSSTYALVGHYGEPVGVAVWRNAGERLPLVAVAVEHEPPVWYVLADRSAVDVLAA
jgi:hypothetical protein